MNVKKSTLKINQSGPNNDNIWDDKLLIKAFEESIQLQRTEVAKNIANATNKKKKQHKSNVNDSKWDEMSENEVAGTSNQTYKIGDFVRATYDEDGIDYEAEILSIDCGDDADDQNDAECRIKFIGYDNEQTVKMADLMSSRGLAERKKQTAEAAVWATNAEVANDSDNGNFNQKQRSRRGCVAFSAFGGQMIPPPPPMPPMLDDLTEESEYLSAMLMAWYMSGYYTGLYQGHKLAKQPKASKNSCKRK